MANKYDKINTAKELVAEVAMHGLSTALDDICRAQDIFGREPIENLAELANNIGRCDSDGNPSPTGTWSGGKETQSTFYMILFKIWNWREATAFYNEHTLGIPAKVQELKSEAKSEREKCVAISEDCDSVKAQLEGQVTENIMLRKDLDDKGTRIKDLEIEVMMLKAKLYDMITKG